jgi:hypothetical protein
MSNIYLSISLNNYHLKMQYGMQDNVIFIISLISITVVIGYTLAYYQLANAQVIYNSANECAASLSTNPPRSPSGAQMPIQQQNITMICANLAGLQGSLASVTSSFTNCMNYLSQQSTLSYDQRNLICINLNPR